MSGSGNYCVLGAMKSPLSVLEFPMMIFGDFHEKLLCCL